MSPAALFCACDELSCKVKRTDTTCIRPFYALLHILFDLIVNAFCIQFIFVKKFHCRS